MTDPFPTDGFPTDIFLDRPTAVLGSMRRSLDAAAMAGDLRSPAAALKAAGFAEHCICPPEQTAYDLASEVLAASNIDTASIDCIIYATCLPSNANLGDWSRFEDSRDVKDIMVFPASRLQAEHGMERAFIIGLDQQGCTGMLGSIRLARNLLVAEPGLQQVLCITADRFPDGALYEQAYNLISDGAAACRVSRTVGGYRVLACHQISNGGLARASDDQMVGSFFNYSHRLIHETLARAGLDLAAIRWIVAQNTNIKAWQLLAGLLGIHGDRCCFDTMASCGHVISADNILNLQSLEASGRLQSGDRILTFMAGIGSHWQCLLLERL